VVYRGLQESRVFYADFNRPLPQTVLTG